MIQITNAGGVSAVWSRANLQKLRELVAIAGGNWGIGFTSVVDLFSAAYVGAIRSDALKSSQNSARANSAEILPPNFGSRGSDKDVTLTQARE